MTGGGERCCYCGWKNHAVPILCFVLLIATSSHAFSPQYYPITNPQSTRTSIIKFQMTPTKPAGAFFNPVPEDDDGSVDDDNDNDNDKSKSGNDKDATNPSPSSSSSSSSSESLDVDKSLEQLIRDRNKPPLASQPSTINGIPTSQAGVGFGSGKTSSSNRNKKNKKTTIISTKTITTTKKSSYIEIGTPDDPKPILNDVTKPEYDDQGYTLYANEETGEKSRVFEALVEYPCDFTMKIVGANEGMFVEEILQVVADSCQVDDVTQIPHKTRSMGKWTSVTVEAPVQNAEMLYALYENVDKDPRVKFKF